MDLTDPGFDCSVLSEFRARLVEAKQEETLLQTVLELCQQRGWLKARGKQRTDSTHILAAIRTINRLECVGETLRAADPQSGNHSTGVAPCAYAHRLV